MLKKLSILFIISAFSVSYRSVQAGMIVPCANITVIEQSIGGDAVFNFNYTSVFDNKNFQIQTTNGTCSYLIKTTAFSNTAISLTESPITGWQNTNVSCQSDDSLVTTYPIDGGIEIHAYPYDFITCTFTNTKQSAKTPVLIVPGILGTEMKKDDDLLWANLQGMLLSAEDDFMDPLMFNVNLEPADTTIEAGQVIRNPENLYDYSNSLITEFQNQGYAEGDSATSTLFTFPYDWRYGVGGVFGDGKTNVDALKQKIADIRALTGSDKVDIIAHSTGGLLVKKYVMEEPTDNHIGKAVFVGVPNDGAPKAIKTLLQGDNFNILFLNDAEMKKIAANLPVSYELAPSEKYVSDNGSYVTTITTKNGNFSTENLDFTQMAGFLAEHNLNSQAFTNATALHSSNFDNFDLRTAGVDPYSIVGCKSGTIGGITEYRNVYDNGTILTNGYTLDDTTGDGTVPMASADSLPANDDHIFYAPKSEHGKLLSADGTRQEIVNIIAGTSLDTGDKVITKAALASDPTKCQLRGHWLGIFSPVSISITDQDGNKADVTSDGSIENTIAGADYQMMGEHKFVFLPTDDEQTYTINLHGTGNGVFTLKDEVIANGAPAQTAVWGNVPVTTNSIGNITLGSSGESVGTLSFDQNGNGNSKIIQPSVVASGNLPDDFNPPIITITSPTTKDYLRSDKFVIDATSTDTGSGVFSFTLSLDGAVATSGEPVDLFFDKLGTHQLLATSTDFMNNTATSSVSFRVVASPESTISDIERAYSLGWLKDKKTKETLEKEINVMVKLETKIDKIESKDKNGKKITKLVERVEERVDKVLAQVWKIELKLYNKGKIVNDKANVLLQEDVQWLLDNFAP